MTPLQNLECILLAGGFGTRLRSVVTEVPKPMAPIRGRPFLEFQLDHFAVHGFRRAILSTGYMAEKIESHFGTQYRSGNHLIDICCVEEKEALGTGGAMVFSGAHLKSSSNPFVVCNGDTWFPVDVSALVECLQKLNADVVMALRKIEKNDRYGSVVVDSQNRVTGFQDAQESKGEAALINGGIYVFRSSKILKDFEWTQGMLSFEKDVLPRWIAQQGTHQKRIFGIECTAPFIDIGIPEDYARAQTEIKK